MNSINKLFFIISDMYWYCYSKLVLFTFYADYYFTYYFSLMQNFISSYISILEENFSYYYSGLTLKLEFISSFESISIILNYIHTILYYISSLGIFSVISILLPVLLSVAFMTIIERKQLAAMQRRVGPNTVGYYGVLQPFADALKLILKENVIPAQSNKIIFYLAPVSSLFFSLLGWAIIPFGPGMTLFDFSMGMLYTLALSSLGVYGILFAGWSANSKYAFLGSLRSTAAMISYELILSSAILIIIIVTGTLNFSAIIEFQESIWLIVPLLPVFLFFFLSILAETSRTPFDLQEAESELVGGFFTEHSSVPFVFFFLSEYSSIVLFSCLTSILFLGGYNLPHVLTSVLSLNDLFFNFPAVVLGIKTCLFCFFFVWFRATLPRLRYDQLMEVCWLYVLPVAVAFILLIPSIILSFGLFM
jgi:NADH-ubiquinone oxidoreductase chain 1